MSVQLFEKKRDHSLLIFSDRFDRALEADEVNQADLEVYLRGKVTISKQLPLGK
mgnify:CR=1 FL=1